MRLCDKRDIPWLTAMMQDSVIFNGCSEDGTNRTLIGTYVKNMIARPDFIVLAPMPGKFVHTFVHQTGVMWEIHTAIKQDCSLSGRERVKLTREACMWMIRCKGARKFITHVPDGNRAAGIYAVACGLKRVGVLTSAMKKDGALINVTLYQTRDEDIKNVIGGM